MLEQARSLATVFATLDRKVNSIHFISISRMPSPLSSPRCPITHHHRMFLTDGANGLL